MLSGAVDMAAQYSGERSPVTVTALAKLARAQLALGQPQAAEQTLVRTLEAARAQYGEQHLHVADGETVLARLHLQQGRLAEARRLADEVAAKLETIGAPGAPLAREVQALRSEIAAAAASGPAREAAGR